MNNAGLGPGDTSVRLHESDDDRWDLVMRVNSRGVYLGCKYAIAQFLKQGLDEKGHRGWIVNVSSMLGMVGIGGGHGKTPLYRSSLVSPSRRYLRLAPVLSRRVHPASLSSLHSDFDSSTHSSELSNV